MNVTEITTIASTVFAGCSALIAAWAVHVPSKNQHDQKLLEEAALSLERAYDALNEGSEHSAPPQPSRLNWLACARHIQSFKWLKAKMTVSLYKDLCAEHEMFWQHQFYLRFTSNPVEYSYYFEKLDSKSVLIVYAFAFAENDKPDAIGDVDLNVLLASIPKVHSRALREHLHRGPILRM